MKDGDKEECNHNLDKTSYKGLLQRLKEGAAKQRQQTEAQFRRKLQEGPLPTIGHSYRYYGVLMGLSTDLHNHTILYALFGENEQSPIWIVPDAQLFRMLTTHFGIEIAYSLQPREHYNPTCLRIGHDQGMWYIDSPWLTYANGTWTSNDCLGLLTKP